MTAGSQRSRDWFRHHEGLLSLLWLLFVFVVVLGWLIYCITPDRERGVFFLMSRLRQGLVDEYFQGARLIEQGSYTSAIPVLEGVVNRTRGLSHRNALGRMRARALMDLSWAYQATGSRGRARRAAEAATFVDRGNFEAHLSYGEILLAQGRHEAGAPLEHAMRLNPLSLRATVDLMKFHIASGSYDEARSVYQGYIDRMQPVFGLMREGEEAHAFAFLADGSPSGIDLPWNLDAGEPSTWTVEVNHPGFVIHSVTCMGAADLLADGRAPVVHVAKLRPELKRVVLPLNVYLMGDNLFAAPTYSLTFDLPPLEAPVSHVKLQAAATVQVSQELYDLALESFRALDDEAGIEQLQAFCERSGFVRRESMQ